MQKSLYTTNEGSPWIENKVVDGGVLVMPEAVPLGLDVVPFLRLCGAYSDLILYTSYRPLLTCSMSSTPHLQILLSVFTINCYFCGMVLSLKAENASPSCKSPTPTWGSCERELWDNAKAVMDLLPTKMVERVEQ